MKELRVRLSISAERFLAYYRGDAKAVIVELNDGRKAQFPANVLQPFLTHDGIHGEFVIRFDERNKLVDVRKL